MVDAYRVVFCLTGKISGRKIHFLSGFLLKFTDNFGIIGFMDRTRLRSLIF